MAESVSKRLIQIREREGKTQKGMSQHLGLGESTWQKWETGTMPSAEGLVKIASLGYEPSWVLLGSTADGERSAGAGISSFLSSLSESFRTTRDNSERDDVLVPFFDVNVSAGPGSQPLTERPATSIAISRNLLRTIGTGLNLAAMPVRGDSAEPYISSGDVIIVDRSELNLQDGNLYVIGVDQDVVLKRVERMVDRSIVLRSDNVNYRSQTVPPDGIEDLRVIGRVRWAIRYL